MTVGSDTVFNGHTHVIGSMTAGSAVTSGDDCHFASGISIRAASHHGLWDTERGELLSPEEDVRTGDHVWLGDQVIVLNRGRIASGSVVGARSIVNRPFDDENTVLAGSPASVRR